MMHRLIMVETAPHWRARSVLVPAERGTRNVSALGEDLDNEPTRRTLLET